VCKLKKFLYGIKQAHRAWYSRLDMHLQQGFRRGVVDNNIYIKKEDKEMIIIVVYVDDMIFGSNVDKIRKQFVEET
jgi:hypothetical protein